MKTIIIVISIILAYLMGVCLTYGYTVVRRDMNTADAGICGVLWPLYWIGRGIKGVASVSEDMFRDPPAQTVEQ